MSLLEVRLLGPLEAGVEGRQVELRRKKQRELLAILALRAGEVVSIDRLVDELWGESPPKAAVGSLQNLVSELRKVLPADVLVTRAPGYVLAVEREAVDAHRFERLAREARGADPQRRVMQLREALALWRGPALADIQLERSVADEAARLEELRVAAWEDRLEAELELGQHSQVTGELESLVAKHPLRERPVGLLMLARYRAGRQSEALETYRRARETLVDELGIDPSPELQRLEQAILRHDPELDLPEAPRKRVPVSEPDRRKTVTVLFADLVDSTELAARLDPEVLRQVLDRYFEVVREAVERHGGIVEKFIGDAAMAVFGIPTLHEDDALRAVRAASELRDALAEPSAEVTGRHGLPLQVRVGLNTGEVFVRAGESGESFATGNAVNVAKRLEEAALPGEILIGESTYRLVSHAVEGEAVDPVEFGGALARASVFRVGGLGETARPLGRAALVGRTDELAWLRAAFAGVQAERRSRVVTVLGEAGIGKSRLAQEFVSTTGEQLLMGRCVSYGEGATFLPLAEIVRQAVPERPRAAILELLEGDDQAPLVAERVTQLTEPADGAASTGEVFWAVRRFLEGLARHRPVVVVLEDIHWAEPTLLDLVEYLDSWPAKAPFLVLCLARGELVDDRPGWGSRNALLALEPLAEVEASALVEEVAAGRLDDDARTQILEIAEGNPLFLEQLLAFLPEAGPAALGSIPPTVEALLAGRLELLDAGERTLLERAAIVGRDFSRGALLTLSPPEELAGLDSRLTALVRRGLVGALRGGDDDTYRFHHVLVRDVAYAGITKQARADLHERCGSWLEQREGPDELVGYHLEQAHRYRSEVRPSDPQLVELAQRAGASLAAAGIRAFRRADRGATVNLLSRAAVLLPRDERLRADILCELAMAQWNSGNTAAALEAVGEAVAIADSFRPEPLLRPRLERSYIELFTDPSGDAAAVVEAAQDAIPTLEELGDERALGRAWRIIGYVRGPMQGRCADWLNASERAAIHYRRSGWSAAGTFGEVAAALYYGPTPVLEATEQCEQLLTETTERVGRASVLAFLGGLAALATRFDEGFALLREADEIYGELGEVWSRANNSGRILARSQRIAGDLDSAQKTFRDCCETLEQVHDEAALSALAAELADTLNELGATTDAARWAQLAEERAPVGDVIAQYWWRLVKARLIAEDGRSEEADGLAREAIALAETTDALSDRGETLLQHAHVLRLAGRAVEAGERAEGALALFEQKGNEASAQLARSVLADVIAV
jgi:class 3 adenylate cyclase/tetratricopeptide (TPR) repeat protein